MADKALVEELRKKAFEMRKDVIKLCRQTAMHIGGDMSCADYVTAVWQHYLKYDPKNPRWEGRDRYILSKGHASALTSLSQAAIGCYDKEDIYKEYATDYGRFGMHSCNLRNPYVDVSTGSLGHGLPIGGGMAMALRLKGNLTSRVYVICGDGELDEGSIWEAAMSAGHFKLGNLVVFVDRNGLQIDGFTEEEMKLEPLADKWRAFGWNVVEIDGNDMTQIVDALDALPDPASDTPTVIIGKTIKGKNIDFMENKVGWHLGMLDENDYNKALASIQAAYERGM
jgi:transketolase